MLTVNHPPLILEQVDLIPHYRRKWQQVALNKEPIDRQQARLAINNAYSFLNLAEPTIIFYSTPNDAINHLNREIDNSWANLDRSMLGDAIGVILLDSLLGKIRTEIKPEIIQQLGIRLDEGRAKNIGKQVFSNLDLTQINAIFFAHSRCFMNRSITAFAEYDELTKNIFKLFFELTLNYNYWQNKIFIPLITPIYSELIKLIIPEQFASINDGLLGLGGAFFAGEFINKQEPKLQLPTIEVGAYFANVIVSSVAADFTYYIDFFHEVLNCPLDRDKWRIFQDLITSCGWIFPYEKTVLVCDRIINL